MANAVYPKFKEALLAGNTDLTGNIKAVLVDTADYTYDAAHEFLDDVAAGARIGTTGNLSGKTYTNGTFDATDASIEGAAGDESEALILYVDSGVEGTSYLICYLDSYTGFPVQENPGDVNITWPGGGIFSL